jgi:hypothetical protein
LFEALQVVAVVCVAIALTPALAHVLELPGKMRLGKDQYLGVQQIYYPGFTIVGAAEPIAAVVLLLLLFATPGGTTFWLTLGAFLALLIMHLVYWILTHPVNNFWLADFKLKGLGEKFFGTDPLPRGESTALDWTVLRDRWEYSHVARAALALVSLILLVIAVAT